MVHKAKLLKIVEELGETPSIVNLNSLDFLTHIVRYAKGYQKERIMSEETAQRVHAVFAKGIEQEAYNLSPNRREWFAQHLYHRPAKELGIA